MKINGISTTGIFIYSEDCSYEKNDFVVKDNYIYICKKDTSSGEEPGVSDKFSIYLGDNSCTVEEFKEYIESEDNFIGNKYVSVKTLKSILNIYMLGLSGKGIIGNNIKYSEDGDFLVTINNKDQSTYYGSSSILEKIMFDENINNAIFRVSRLLPEIISYVGDFTISENSTTDKKSCILKQYTYRTEDGGDRIRTQELIDPLSGLIYYRSANIDSTVNTRPTSFRCSVINLKDIKSKIENVYSMYCSKLKIMNSFIKNLKDNFRFRSISIDTGNISLILNRTDKTSSTYVDKSSDLTILITEKTDNLLNIYKNHEFTVNLLDLIDNTYPNYYITDDYYLEIKELDTDRISLSICSSTKTCNGSIWFSSIYYREYYV